MAINNLLSKHTSDLGLITHPSTIDHDITWPCSSLNFYYTWLLDCMEYHWLLSLSQKSMYLSIDSIGKIFDSWIRNLGFNPYLHQILTGVFGLIIKDLLLGDDDIGWNSQYIYIYILANSNAMIITISIIFFTIANMANYY